MSKNARERAKEAKLLSYREAILEAAQSCFADAGIRETKMEALATATGVSLATVYSAFPGGKPEIVAALHASRLEPIVRCAITAAASAGPPTERLENAIRAAIEVQVDQSSYTQMQLREGFAWNLGDAIHESVPGGRAFFEEGLEALSKIISEGVAAGVMQSSDPRRTGRTIGMLQQVHLADWVGQGRRASAGDVFEGVWEDIRRLLLIATDGA